jgi:hypothetical protein
LHFTAPKESNIKPFLKSDGGSLDARWENHSTRFLCVLTVWGAAMKSFIWWDWVLASYFQSSLSYHASSPFCSGYFGDGGRESCKLFAWVDLKPQSSWSQSPK